ncbi:MAG: sulfatase-like hydrolase/transferase [Clostridia bacterium]
MKKKPNILFILSDDQGAWAMHCAGTPELHTPNLDRLAKSGARFENFFCASPVCSPARASLLTGNIPSAHGVHDWLRSGNVDRRRFCQQGLENPYGGYADEDEPIQYLRGQPTYTDMLAESGYACALVGKWHLGDSVTPQHGFSRWFTLGKGGCFYKHPDVVENGEITVRHGQYVTDLLTDQALAYLNELKQTKQPFYLSVHYTAPHSPWEAEQHPQEYIQMYENCAFESIPDVPDHPDMTTGPVYGTSRRKENLRGYFAAITAMDAGIGRLLDALEDVAQDTLVIFAGDNGMSMGHHGIWGKGNGTYPMNMYDTAVKVPFLLRYPPMTRAGSVVSELVSAYDLFPTLVALVGSQSRVCEKLPGRSFLPMLCGQAQEPRGVVICDEYGPVRMLRTREMKYIHQYPYGPHALYDLVNDPGETTNLIDDPNWQAQALEMRQALERWFLLYANPALDGSREGVTGSGQLCSSGAFAEKLQVYAPPPTQNGQC